VRERDPKQLGRELAKRMVARMRTRNIPAKDALRRVASEVVGRANTLVAQGKDRDEEQRWVGEVQAACAQSIEEHLRLSDEQGSRRAVKRYATGNALIPNPRRRFSLAANCLPGRSASVADPMIAERIAQGMAKEADCFIVI